MFESHFGLSGPPFQLNADPAFFFGSRGHSHALAYMRFGVHQAEGFIVVTGEVGAGKTTLVRTLMAGLEHVGKRLSSKQRAQLRGAVASGVAYLVESQTEDGWPFDMVYGVFNKNCMINYDNYRYYFPLWALARAARLDQLLS